MLKSTMCAVSFFLAFSSSALAYWDVQNSGEDVFGNVNVTASSIGDNGNLIRFECGSSSEPFFAFLVRDRSGSIPEISAEFLHVDKTGQRHKADAILTSWNDKYVAVKVTDKLALRRLAEHMIVASKSIPVGIIISAFDIKVSDTFSPRGSTAAGRTVLEHCLPEASSS